MPSNGKNSLVQSVPTGCWAQPACYWRSTDGHSFENKAAPRLGNSGAATPLAHMPSRRTYLLFCLWMRYYQMECSCPVQTQQRLTFALELIFNSVVCLTAGPKPLPKRVLHRVQAGASSFSFQHPLVSWTSSRSCVHLLPRLSVISSLYLSLINVF
jgi:hypothetical protein